MAYSGQVHRPRSGLRGSVAHRVGLGLALLTVIVGGPASAHADAGPSVSIDLGGGNVHVIQLNAELPQDREPATYIYRVAQGSDPTQFLPPGWSIRGLLVVAGADPDTTYTATITGPVGGPVVLTAPDFADPPDFVEGQGTSFVFVESGGQPTFFRPERDESDLNALDVRTGTGGTLSVVLQAGAHLHVTARADRTKVDAGQAVHFTSHVSGQQEGEHLAYHWDFGDGATSAAAAPTHTYRAAGRTYHVSVTVTGDLGSGGSSHPPLTITVGKKPGHSGPGGGSKGHTGSGSPSGPSGQGGNGNGNGKTSAPDDAKGTSANPTGHTGGLHGKSDVRVQGVLISGASPERQEPSAPRRAFGVGGTDQPGPALGGVLSGLGAIGLFAFGLALELRRPLGRPSRSRMGLGLP